MQWIMQDGPCSAETGLASSEGEPEDVLLTAYNGSRDEVLTGLRVGIQSS